MNPNLRIIQPSVKIWEQGNSLSEIYQHIERCGRVCYKSEDHINDESALKFVSRLKLSGHGAMLEHGTAYLVLPYIDLNRDIDWDQAFYFFKENQYSRVVPTSTEIYITTNMRVIMEDYDSRFDNTSELLEYLSPMVPEYHSKRLTAHFVLDRGISHEFVRHRKFSFAQESTRYCNYSKDKFNGMVSFIQPYWINGTTGEYNSEELHREILKVPRESLTDGEFEELLFLDSIAISTTNYLNLLEHGATPQEARQVLPTALKTELVMTGYLDDWDHFFDLRLLAKTGKPHPDAKKLAKDLSEELFSYGFSI